ncbi:MAG TPA: hypothetical protein VF338_06640, partial [Leptolinea sp.]
MSKKVIFIVLILVFVLSACSLPGGKTAKTDAPVVEPTVEQPAQQELPAQPAQEQPAAVAQPVQPAQEQPAEVAQPAQPTAAEKPVAQAKPKAAAEPTQTETQP